MIYKKGICSCHNKERYIVNVKYNLCSEGAAQRSKAKKQKSIRNVSFKQSLINKEYYKVINDMDNDKTIPKICSGCGKSYREVNLSHSHIISREDCHNIGKPELIYDKNNITYHCLSIGEHTGCHDKWHIKERITLLDYNKNIEYIKNISNELYYKYKI